MSTKGSAGVPPVRRMRGWRLYAEDGSRFLDLRLLDNRAFVGAKGRFAGTRAKNGVDLGLLKEAPSRHTERLRSALREAFPEAAAFRLYRNEERALAALSSLASKPDSGSSPTRNRPLARSDLYDPLRRDSGAPGTDEPAAVHRFFLEAEEAARLSAFPYRLLSLPCPAPFAPGVLVLSSTGAAESVPEDELPPIQPFTALRAWEDFRAPTLPLTGGRRARSGEGAPSYTETLWARTDRRLSGFFQRRGPYLYARCSESDWPAFRAKAVEGGCLLTPEWGLPSIVPGEFDDGELGKLARAMETL